MMPPTRLARLAFGIWTCLASIAFAAPDQVHCPPKPAEGVHDLMLTPIWEVPAEDDDYLVSRVVDATHDADGNLCLLDFALKNVTVFDDGGNWLRTIGREGEGPGELRDARKLFRDGSRLGVLQLMPAAIVWLEADGTPSGKAHLGAHDPEAGNFVSASHAVQVGSRIFLWMNRMEQVESGGFDRTSWIATSTPDGTLGPVLYEPPEQENPRVDDGIDEGKVYDIWLQRWTGDAEGGVWLAPERDRYLLQHWNADGELDLEITRDYGPVVRGERGRQSIVTWFKRRGWTEDQIHVGKTAPVVRQLRMADDGNLWVGLDLGGGGEDDDLVRVFDVFGVDGMYLRRMRFRSELEFGSIRFLGDDLIVAVCTDEEGEQVIAVLGVEE